MIILLTFYGWTNRQNKINIIVLYETNVTNVPNVSKLNKPTNPTENTSRIKLFEKLTYHNNIKWCKLMHIAISSRGWRFNHITAAPPIPTYTKYSQWAQWDSVVISWVIANINPDIVNQFIDYTTHEIYGKGLKISWAVIEKNSKFKIWVLQQVLWQKQMPQ